MLKITITLALVSFAISFNANAFQSDSTTIRFNIEVPGETPEQSTIFWAGTQNNWDPGNYGAGFGRQELAKSARFNSGQWALDIKAPTGSEVSYKYTRGSIFSAEEAADYNYKQPRTVTFDQSKTIYDTVRAWHDIPPEALAGRWPKIKLEKADLTITRDGIVMRSMATLLYSRHKNRLMFDFDESKNRIKSIDLVLTDTVAYYQRISPYTDQFQMVIAGRHTVDGPWQIYVDQNNDQGIESNEHIFSLSDKSLQAWSGIVTYTITEGGSTSTDSVQFTVRQANDLPNRYRSSRGPEAPNLVYEIPFEYRSAQLDDKHFYLQGMHQYSFKDFHRILIDRNNNDTLEVGFGSNETYSIDASEMHRQQKYYLYPTFQLDEKFWTVATVDSNGDWIRFRPAIQSKTKKRIVKGDQIPSWEAKTLNGQQLSSKNPEGKYVLMDFWGSWCGPCIDQIPVLKKVHQEFDSQNFEIIGFAYEGPSTLKKTISTYDMTWPQVVDLEGRYQSTFNVYSYPTYILVDPNGKIVATNEELKSGKLYQTITKYLSQEP